MSNKNINLPKTSFSMKANLPNKEPGILKIWDKLSLYKKLRKSRKGKKLGRKLGYRTCNIHIKNYILPKAGIYAVKVLIENKKYIYNGVAYLGSRPTFGGKKTFLEINIFDINKNLYNKKLRVFFLKFIRGDQKFKNPAKLIRQMNKDVIFAKKGLKTKLKL